MSGRPFGFCFRDSSVWLSLPLCDRALQIVRLHKLLDNAHARIVRVEAEAEQLRSELALSLLGQPTVSMPRHAELIGRSVSAAAALGVLLYCTGSTQ